MKSRSEVEQIELEALEKELLTFPETIGEKWQAIENAVHDYMNAKGSADFYNGYMLGYQHGKEGRP